MATNPDSNPYTLLRIKRKRNEEPLDGLGNILVWWERKVGNNKLL